MQIIRYKKDQVKGRGSTVHSVRAKLMKRRTVLLKLEYTRASQVGPRGSVRVNWLDSTDFNRARQIYIS